MAGDLVLSAGEAVLADSAQLPTLQQQVKSEMAAISAALAGDNELPTQGAVQQLEQSCLDAEDDLMALIRGNRMRHDRRAISLKAKDLVWEVDNDMIKLSFTLDSGSFATSIVRELIEEIPVERHYD